MSAAQEGAMPASKQAGDEVGFASGGLGGFNACGIGFLQATSSLKVKPAIITYTSGMIYWTAKWVYGEDGEFLDRMFLRN
jgi:hypothetical protein